MLLLSYIFFAIMGLYILFQCNVKSINYELFFTIISLLPIWYKLIIFKKYFLNLKTTLFYTGFLSMKRFLFTPNNIN